MNFRRLRRPLFLPLLPLALVAAALSTSPTPAFAQTAGDQAAAEALFKAARELMAAGKYAEACPKLAESQRLDPGTGTLLNLGSCYERNGQLTSAWATYMEAASAAQSAGEQSRVKLARARAAALEPTLSTLTIVVPPSADRPDLQVTRDGAVVGRAAWGVRIPVDPGAHTVEASAPGHKTWEARPRVVGAGTVVSVEIPLLEEASPPSSVSPAAATPTSPSPSPVSPVSASPAPPAAAETRPSPRSGSAQRAAGLVIAGTGIVGLISGGVAGGLALSKKNAVAAQCNGPVCNADGIASLNGANSAATVSTVAFIAGGAMLAAGAILFFVAPHAQPAATGWTFAPGSDGAIAGITLERAW